MRIRELDHLVFLVPNIDDGIRKWENILGFSCNHKVIVSEVGIGQAFFVMDDGTFIELVAPTSEESTLSDILDKSGEGLRLLSLRVDNLDDAVKDFINNGVALTGVGTDRVFIDPSESGEVLIQLWPADRPHRWRDALSLTNSGKTSEDAK